MGIEVKFSEGIVREIFDSYRAGAGSGVEFYRHLDPPLSHFQTTGPESASVISCKPISAVSLHNAMHRIRSGVYGIVLGKTQGLLEISDAGHRRKYEVLLTAMERTGFVLVRSLKDPKAKDFDAFAARVAQSSVFLADVISACYDALGTPIPDKTIILEYTPVRNLLVRPTKDAAAPLQK